MTTRISTRAIAAVATAVALTVIGAGPAAAKDRPPADSQPTQAEAPALTLLGFLRDKDGEFTTIVPPGSTGTKAAGLNDRGEVVGIGYPREDGNGGGFGFLRDKKGDYTTFVYPGTGPESRTVAADINNRGQIAGWSDDGQTSVGYIRQRNGDFRTIEHPEADEASPLGSGTSVTGINNRGDVVGNYAADGTVYGFVRDRRGNFTHDPSPRGCGHLPQRAQ